VDYCTLDDLIKAFGESEIIRISDRGQRTGQVNDVVVTRAISDAEAEINMYLEGRGLLPLPSLPEVIRRIAVDISRFYLYQNPKDDGPVQNAYKQRVRQLEGIASGKLSLGLDDAGKVMEPEDTVIFTPGRNMFRRNGLW
jgi:phage gp36-like protein